MRRSIHIKAPVFVLNLPKSGTKSINKFFDCGLGYYWSTHHGMRNASGYVCRVGECMGRNHAAGRPLVEGCGGYVVYTDAGAIWDVGETDAVTAPDEHRKERTKQCFFPGLHGLQNIATHYPDATIIHVYRDTKEWIKSARGWLDLLTRLSMFCQGFPKIPYNQTTASDENWEQFYEHYKASIRMFAQANPSLTYIEAELESPLVSTILENATGLPARCFKHHHKTQDVRRLLEEKQTGEKGRANPRATTRHDSTLNVSTPIFAMHLPEMETMALHKYFQCGLGVGQSCHRFIQDLSQGEFVPIASCLSDNIAAGRPMIENCGKFVAYSDPGGLWYDKNSPRSGEHCFIPGLHGLDHIGVNYPNATLLHIHQNPQLWVQVARSRQNNDFLVRLATACRIDRGGDFASMKTAYASDKDWIEFSERYSVSLRTFVREHPSLTLIEASLEDPNLPEVLEAATGIPGSCYGRTVTATANG